MEKSVKQNNHRGFWRCLPRPARQFCATLYHHYLDQPLNPSKPLKKSSKEDGKLDWAKPALFGRFLLPDAADGRTLEAGAVLVL